MEKLFEQLGFVVHQTGGGCLAYRLAMPFGYILVTDEDGCDLPEEGDKLAVGFYDNEGNVLFYS